jgi:hypothetical protein
MKWHWLEKSWKERPEWIKKAKHSFNTLLIEYERYEVNKQYRELLPALLTPPTKRQRRSYDDSSSDDSAYEASEASDMPITIQQQLVNYQNERAPRDLSKYDSPVPYWLSKQSDWPHLAAMALDIYSVPVMSDEPERVFSITGAAITPRRRLLNSEKIGHLMCLKAWQRSGLISLDR